MAQGDYEVLDGFALVPTDDPDAWGLGQVSEGEAFGMYLPEEPGLYGFEDVAGCGGRCEDQPENFTGSARYVQASERAKLVDTKFMRFAPVVEEEQSMGNLGSGLVQMISGFGDLGYTEYLAYGDLNDLREGYPLGQVDIAGDEYGFPDEQYEDYAPAPPPDMTDVPQANTPDQAELADILEQRRQAIADAIKQRNLMTQKVADLDHQIVEVLNPQYQQALAADDQEQAIKIGGEIRVLNLKRAEAVQKALDWAQFQATAAQMAKNVRAQLALNLLYQETLNRQDPQMAAAISRTYAEIGQATAALKQARAQQLAAQQAAAKQQQAQLQASAQQAETARMQQKVTTLQARLQTLQAQYDAAVKEVAALKSKPGMKIIPKVKTDAMQRLALLVKSAKNMLAKAKQEMATKQAQIPLSMQRPVQPMPQQQGYGYDPYADQEYGYEEFQGLDGLDAFDATVPYCALYTRDGYGPTCMQAGTMQLGGWSEPSYPSLAEGIAGIGELASELENIMDIGSAWDVAGKIVGASTQAVVEEAGKRAKAQKSKHLCKLECYKLGGPNWKKDQALCIAKCEAGGGPDVKDVMPNPFVAPTSTPLWKRWWFFPALLAAGGIGYGIYSSMQSPRGMQGFGRVSRRRRRHRR
jgi:hypothetical protein